MAMKRACAIGVAVLFLLIGNAVSAHVLTFAAMLLVCSGVHFLKGNDLVSVLVFGLTLTDLPAVRERLHFDETAGPTDFTNCQSRTTRRGSSFRENWLFFCARFSSCFQ